MSDSSSNSNQSSANFASVLSTGLDDAVKGFTVYESAQTAKSALKSPSANVAIIAGGAILALVILMVIIKK